jgi:hypothetical protein
MRKPLLFLLLAVAGGVAEAQFGVGIRVPVGRSTARLRTVPDTLALHAPGELDLRPHFTGGEEAWQAWMRDGCAEPALPAACGGRARVVVRFVVEADGRITAPEAVEADCPEAAARAVCALQAAAPWQPGRIGATKVRTRLQQRLSLRQR